VGGSDRGFGQPPRRPMAWKMAGKHRIGQASVTWLESCSRMQARLAREVLRRPIRGAWQSGDHADAFG